MGCLLWVFGDNWPCYNWTPLYQPPCLLLQSITRCFRGWSLSCLYRNTGELWGVCCEYLKTIRHVITGPLCTSLHVYHWRVRPDTFMVEVATVLGHVSYRVSEIGIWRQLILWQQALLCTSIHVYLWWVPPDTLMEQVTAVCTSTWKKFCSQCNSYHMLGV